MSMNTLVIIRTKYLLEGNSNTWVKPRHKNNEHIRRIGNIKNENVLQKGGVEKNMKAEPKKEEWESFNKNFIYRHKLRI
jgi:hypothetical protein